MKKPFWILFFVAALISAAISGCSSEGDKLYVDLRVDPPTVKPGEAAIVNVSSPGVDLSESGTKLEIVPDTGLVYNYGIAPDGISLDIHVNVAESHPESCVWILAETKEVVADGWLSIREPDAGVDSGAN